MTIIGGTYREIDELSSSKVIYGSGLRALEVQMELDTHNEVTYYSCCKTFERFARLRYARYGNRIQWNFVESPDVFFYYTHPFNLSGIIPRPDYFLGDCKQILTAEDDNILVFGMVEAKFRVSANRVVYDPQTSVSPVLFSATGSRTERLVYVLNIHEAKVLSGCDNVEDQARFFFEHEHCESVVIKCGSNGAFVFEGSVDAKYMVPVYKTSSVHCIGSGDVFSATFAYFWFAGNAAAESARKASMAVACYADIGLLTNLSQRLESFDYQSLQPSHHGKIYLAGPFFSFYQRWLVNEFYKALQHEDVDVFSPLHHVGLGGVETVQADLTGLDTASVLLAIADGLDAGTMFEVGYAVKRGIPVVVFNTCESEGNLQMLEGTGCEFEKDFATAVYKTIWHAIN